MQQKILILAANPKGTTSLRLDEEVREIDADFSVELISYLDSTDDKQALWKICKELEVVFKRGKYAADLENIKSKLKGR